MSGSLAVSAELTATLIPNTATYQYSISLSNISAGTQPGSIATFWFAWDDVPEANFMTVQPTQINSPSGWFGLVTHGPATGDGYGIEWYTFSNAVVQPTQTLTGFSFRSTETPDAMLATSPIEPTFSTVSSFVYPTWPPDVAGTSGANFVVACFRSGTRIRTPKGDIRVEDLAIGDPVVTAAGDEAPIRWIGHRSIDCSRHPAPSDVWPVRISAGAFGPGLPEHALDVSPDHAVFVHDRLIPIRALVDGQSVTQHAVAEVTYFHLALGQHDVILAEGLPCESYIDSGGQIVFDNASTAPHWCEGLVPCAPRVTQGPIVEQARQMLAARAAGLVAST
jgi:hypothetical protein